MSVIKQIHGREILDSRGNPTVEVDVHLADGTIGRAAVPSGASTGSQEAFELRDNDSSHFGGKGVTVAVKNVNEIINKALIGFDIFNQCGLDKKLIDLDGTENKKRLGANAILGVSLAATRAASNSLGIPLYRYISEKILQSYSTFLPVPMFNILNGGVHADNSVDIQEFMIAPIGVTSIREAVRAASEVYQALKTILKKKKYSVSIGDEGGFAPDLKENIEAIELILEAISLAHYTAGKDIVIAIDAASSEFYKDGRYTFSKSDSSVRTSEQLIDFYENWIRQFPIFSLEDGLAEQDWSGWKRLTERLGNRIQLVGDDIFVTNPKIIQKAIDAKVANAVLIKLNQIGTLTETLEAIRVARSAEYSIVISHRSGETPDDFIADFAVAVSAAQIKAGAPARGERIAKYNQLMRIEEELGAHAKYAGLQFKRTSPANDTAGTAMALGWN